ncbi:MAG TPA: glycogen synthase GlgA [Cellvibrio sp.]|nr:glycogen synthase GlgA [Cellvibrio sp.]
MGSIAKVHYGNDNTEHFQSQLTAFHEQNEHQKKILFVTPEYTGLIKAGGLGDVSAALPKALKKRHDVRILIPGYREILQKNYPMTIIARLEGVARIPTCKIGRMEMGNGTIIYVVICPELYDREGSPYGNAQGQDWHDNHIRFARLGLAAADMAMGKGHIGWRPDIIHANDWPSALAPAYIALRNQPTPSIFTIHNLAYQGLFNPDCCTDIGLPHNVFCIEQMEFFGQLSFMKAGLVFSTSITTVSETYAREITQPEFGCGLHGLLQAKFNQGLLRGITNGIDESWEASTDPNLVAGFKARQWEAKRKNTRHVEALFGLANSDAPLFAVVSRLAPQKGVDLTLGIADSLVQAGGRLTVMGTGDPSLESALVKLARRYPRQVGVHIGFQETEARRLFAGSDFLLMPSRFEPCGLSQLYAQRFASLPIATRTGGLIDTIEDGLNGFLFHETTVASYQSAIQRAMKVYEREDLLNAMRCRAMNSPQFWQESVRPYDLLYRQLDKFSRQRNFSITSGGIRVCR